MSRSIRIAARDVLLAIVLIWLTPVSLRVTEPIPLAGGWRLALDRADAGVKAIRRLFGGV